MDIMHGVYYLSAQTFVKLSSNVDVKVQNS